MMTLFCPCPFCSPLNMYSKQKESQSFGANDSAGSTFMFNRPGVAGAVLQTALSLIK